MREGLRRANVVASVAAFVALGTGLVYSQSAFAAPDRTATVNGASSVATWDGAAATAFNASWAPLSLVQPGQPSPTGICGKVALNYCEETVVNAEVAASAGAKLAVFIDALVADDDFDVFVYESDAAGTAGEFVVGSTKGAGNPEFVSVDKASGFYLVRVVYFQVIDAGYKGTVKLTGAPAGATVAAPGTPSPSSPPPSSPQTLPASGPLTISFAADRGKRSTARERGLRVRVRCSVQCKTTATAKIDKKVAKALKLGKKAVTIGTAKATIIRPGRIPFFIKLTKKAKKALARKDVKKFKVKLAIAVVDTSGKQLKRGTKTITLR